jgi:hypothetical protein
MAIVEICGFNDWLLEMLKEYGCCETVLIQPEKRSRKKTDRRDASALSQLLWVSRQRVLGGKRAQGLKRIILPSQEEQDNRQLTSWRQRTAVLRTRTINKVQHILLKHNLQQECPTKGMKTKSATDSALLWMAEQWDAGTATNGVGSLAHKHQSSLTPEVTTSIFSDADDWAVDAALI